jgi:cell division FtsZ-interacting protein ZapD
LTPSVVQELFFWFNGQTVDCGQLKPLEMIQQGSPICALVPWTLDELRQATLDLSKERGQLGTLRFSTSDNNFILQDGDFMNASDGLYVFFYFNIIEEKYRYILQFVKRDGENMIVIYPPMFG